MTHDLVIQYTVLVEFLSKTLGPDYEITLHNVRNKKISIVAISNGHISGRNIESPPSNNAMKILSDKLYENSDYMLNYRGISSTNKILRTSTMFIKDEQGELIGLLCINFDDLRYKELSEKVFELCHPNDYVVKNVSISVAPDEPTSPPSKDQDGYYENIAVATDDVLSLVLENTSVPVDRLTQKEKMNIVGFLDEKNVFMLKGAVSYVAEKLCCSQASIYRYLSKINRQKERLQNDK